MDALNRLQSHVPELLVWLQSLQNLSSEQWLKISLALMITGPVTLFTLKNLLIFVLRQFGLYSPELYGALPRLPWRGIYNIYCHFSYWKELIFTIGTRSSGGFASYKSTMLRLYQPYSFLIGRVYLGGLALFQPVGVWIERHILIVAMTGAGKSVLMKGSVALWMNSAFIIDPKNEIGRDLALLDTRRTWITLHPYAPDITGQVNPFDCITEALKISPSHAIRVAHYIGQSFIETPPDAKQPYFTDASRGFLVGLLLWVVAETPPEQHNLGTVRDLIVFGLRVYKDDGTLETTQEEARALLYKLMMECEAFNGAIAGSASPFITASAETHGNLESTLQEKTKVLDIPSVRYMLQRTTRPLSELKSCDDYVMSFAPSISSLKGELKDLARLLTNLVIFTFEVTRHKNGQCLAVVDELNAQGYNSALETALPIARSMGLSICAIAQDIEGIKGIYPKTWKAFIGNADVAMFLGTNHPDNLKFITEALGKNTFVSTDPQTDHEKHREVEVMTAEQVGRFLAPDKGNMIAFLTGRRALKLKLAKFYEELPVTRYLPDPNHGEPLLKRFSRFVLTPLIARRKHKAIQRQNHYLKPQTPSQETEQ